MIHQKQTLCLWLMMISSLILLIFITMAKSEDTKMSTQILGEVSLEKTTVEIYNKLDNGTLLTVHCKSKDDDLGSHDLSENQSFRWKFRINIYGTTLFYCRFTWKGGSKTFNIFDAKRDENRCPPTCIWRVRNDGVHAYHDVNQKDDQDDIFFKWDQPDSSPVIL
ncbi:hypothetical protein CsatA_024634 [Cannabis sativa]